MSGSNDMVGREDELKELEKLLKEAKEGKGKLVFIAGNLGIGKTKLLEALADSPEAKDCRVIKVSGVQGGDPFLPLVEAIRQYEEQRKEETKSDEKKPGEYEEPLPLSFAVFYMDDKKKKEEDPKYKSP
jgi:predicted ATPase